MNRIITVADLSDACPEQVALFRATFGEQVECTAEAIEKAIAAGLYVTWCLRLLSNAARAAYERVRNAAWAEYERVRDAAWAECERVSAAAMLAALNSKGAA